MRITPFLLALSLQLYVKVVSAQPDQRSFGPFGQIYQLTDAEAVLLLGSEKAPAFSESWLHTLVDTFYGAGPRRPLLPGHYLLAEAVGEEVELEVLPVQTIRVWLLPNFRDFTLVVTDSAGNAIRDARVLLRGKQAPFDTVLQCYRLPRRWKNGFVEVYAAGESWFGQLKNEFEKPLWLRRLNYGASHGVGKIVAMPLRFGRAGFYRIKNRISEGYWERPYRRNRQSELQGYIALNQPKYQPGDTLRVKAYVAGRKGRPWRKPLELDITERHNPYRTVLQRDVHPLTPGAFVFEMPLGDTLRLDQQFVVTFTEKVTNPDREGRFISESFTLEDYQLDENTFTLEPARTEFRRGEPVKLRLTARDANDLPVPDARLHLVLLPDNISDIHTDAVYIPDTLWQHEQAFSMEDETTIVVPDSIWPEASLRVNAQVYCTTSSGEQQQKKSTFTVLRKHNSLKARIEGGYILVERSLPYPLPDSVLLLETGRGEKEKRIRAIQLPFRERVSPGMQGYTVKTGEQTLDIYFPEAEVAVTNQAYQRDDSVFFALINPHGTEIRFSVFEGKKMLEEGVVTDSIWTWRRPAKQGHAYGLSYRFVWAGQTFTFYATALFYKNLLNIRLEQPDKVQPGEQVQVKIKVEDAGKRPVQGVNLTAGAYNRQFGHETPYSSPDISYNNMRCPLAFNRYKLSAIENRPLRTVVTKAWYDRLQLDSVLYYRLRYRGAGWYTESFPVSYQPVGGIVQTSEGLNWGMPYESDSFYQQRPQFAPHVIRANQAQPVYLVYCNSQLVYYYGATNWQPYSFYGWYGYNQIKIRTRDGEYTLDSVYLKAKEKLEIAIDGDRIAGSKALFRVRFEARPDTLTAFEQQTLQRTMLIWQPDGKGTAHYFWNGPENIQLAGGQYVRGQQIAGPFYSNQTLYYLNSGALFSRFNFEPGFEYRISAGRERLYKSTWPKGATGLLKSTRVRHPGDLAWGPHHVIVRANEQPVLPAYKWAGLDQPGKSSLQLRLERGDTLLAIALAGDTLHGPYRPGVSRIDGLPPGHYRLLVFGAGGSVWQREISLLPDTLLFLDLLKIQFRPARAEESFGHFFTYPAKPAEPAPDRPRSQFSQWPGAMAGTNGIRGVLTDEHGEPLIGAAVFFRQAGIDVGAVLTDFDGVYQMFLPPGIYDVEYQYTGYTTQTIAGVSVTKSGLVPVNQQLEPGAVLNEVVVVSYKIPLIEQDMTSAGQTLTSYQIKNLPTRNINALQGQVAGAVIPNEDGVFIKGSRSNQLNVYVDGIRISRNAAFMWGEATAAEAVLRTRFRDYAYWQPNLITDQNGEASFRVTFPDNITSWNSFVLGMDRKKRAGMFTQNTRAYKPLLAKLSLPRFAVAGDRFDVAGLTTNLSGDSVAVHTVFRFDGQVLQENRTRIGEGLVEFARVATPASGADSLYLSYEMDSPSATDGERRSIAILPVGTRETTGQFLLFERDTALRLSVDPALGPVTVQVQDNALDLLFEDIRYLRDYPYSCNEQTASRLLALLAEEKIVTAGAQNPKETKSTRASLAKEIAKCLNRLQNGQLADGSWGWWAGGTPNAWMTVYVLRALREARAAGYTRPEYQNGLVWLRHETPGLPPAEQREALLLLREADVNFDCTPYLARLDTLRHQSLYERLSHWRLQQLCGQKISIDSLQKILLPTITGGLYCGDESTHWYNRRANNTLLAYDIAREAGWTDITRRIRYYWLENRPAARQRNTIETAQLLRRLLPELLAGAGTMQPNRLEINGKVFEKFPLNQVLPEGESVVSLHKSGSTPLYLSVSQQWQNASPVPRSDVFEVKSRLEQGGRTVDSLQLGKPAELVVSVHVRQSADYVMLEAPVPAGCSYGEKNRVQLPETHREYFRDRTAIFLEKLPVGHYEFRIPLEPRFTGRFTLNPVRVEQMYFPVFYGRNGVEAVTVGH